MVNSMSCESHLKLIKKIFLKIKEARKTADTFLPASFLDAARWLESWG